MNSIHFIGMSTQDARHLQAGRADHHGHSPEHQISDGDGNPCRHCLEMIGKNEPMLVVSYRPFETTNPYAEQGPIFLHAKECAAFCNPDGELPPVLRDSASYLLRGYSDEERIVYGSGGVVHTSVLTDRAAHLLAQPNIAFVDVRSASNNCWQARILRSD